MIKYTAQDDGTSNGTSHTLRSGMKGNFHVPFWREVEEGNFFYSPNPDNWKELALTVKQSRNWCCECCGKRCYKPGERPEGLSRSEWTADILQVHHRNHNQSDNRLTNLMSVCAACHLGLHRSKYSPVSEGQLSLW